MRGLPADRRDDVTADLDEVYRRRLEAHGAVRADLWYWREATLFVTRFTFERLRDRRRARARLARREGFRRGALPVSLLDVKIGLRRLTAQWGLTLVGGMALTTAMTMGAVVFGLFDAIMATSIPLDEGDRVVALQAWDGRANARRQISAADYLRWHDRLISVEDVGAFHTVARNLVTGDAPPEPVAVAEITASGFTLARVPPLLGRPLTSQDEEAGAEPVVVIGYDAWRGRFALDSAVVGQQVRLGRTVHTVVGVMPEGFSFPMNHNFWTPLRLDETPTLRTVDGQGAVFARLTPGASVEQAGAELAALGLTEAETQPSPRGAARTRVVLYPLAFVDDFAQSPIMLGIIVILASLLLVPPCANLAILVYARSASRLAEFAARHALGASRGRIVSQLFVETFLLAAASGVVALILVRLALGQVAAFLDRQIADRQVAGGLPFWFDVTPSLATVLLVTLLALVAATIAGLLPGLQATGRMMKEGLAALGSRTDPRLGRTWTVLVVAQVGFAVAATPTALEMAWGTLRPSTLGPGFPAEEYLTARLELDAEGPGPEDPAAPAPAGERLVGVLPELVRRLEAEPGIAGATVASALPGTGRWAFLEMEPVNGVDPARPPSALQGDHLIQLLRVGADFWRTFELRALSGRLLNSADGLGGQEPIVVNESFVRLVMGGRSPVGHRLRYTRYSSGSGSPPDEDLRWFEIVGVVPDLPASVAYAIAYHPAAPGDLQAPSLAVHVEPGVTGAAGRIREIAAGVDPTLRLEEVRTLDDLYRQQAFGNMAGASALLAATLSVLLLSAAGMYALMSFTVQQRRREIGIRAALGAGSGRLLAGVFRRAARQLLLGAAVGGSLALLIDAYVPEETLQTLGGWKVPGVLPATAAFMVVVGLLAALGPARRGLRVDPAEAMRGDG
jgi:predicted permease